VVLTLELDEKYDHIFNIIVALPVVTE